jgi:sugar O-acyltransferase (sialic acid O-acetyltransferase NeuD family)
VDKCLQENYSYYLLITSYMLLYGGSGHAKVIIDCLLANHLAVHGLFDDNSALTSLLHFPVLGPYDPKCLPAEELIISIGNNRIRQKVAANIRHVFGKTIHPSALLSTFATLDEGSVLIHQSVVQAGSVIGKHCIINTSASVDHDCMLEDFVHISPHATLSGNVKVGEGTHIGAGATVIQGISIGKWCMVGAGAVVVRDVPDYATVVGVPAKIIKIRPEIN